MGKEEFDYMEAARFSLYGGFYVAPTLFCWLKSASYFWPKPDFRSAITKVCMYKKRKQFILFNFIVIILIICI